MSQPAVRYFVGVDLGQVSDFTALAVLERPVVSRVEDVLMRRRPNYALRHLCRLPLGTPYPTVAQSVVSMLGASFLTGCTLVVDQTGVGRAVVNMLVDTLQGQVSCTLFPITITAGHEVTAGHSGGLQVPKKELVGTLQLLLQTRRLQVARTLPEAAVLVKELENFRIKITVARNEIFESWREGPHDDLVLAVALAAWMGEETIPTVNDIPQESTFERYIV